MNPTALPSLRRSAAFLLCAAGLAAFLLAGPGPAHAQQNRTDAPDEEIVECDFQPGFKGLTTLTLFIENEAAEQEDVLDSLNLPTRPVPPPRTLTAKEARSVIRAVLRERLPGLRLKEIPDEFQPPESAVMGSHNLLQARLEVGRRTGELWEQQVDLYLYRRVTVDQTREGLFAVVWQATGEAQAEKPEQLIPSAKSTLTLLLREFECRYLKADEG